MTMRIMVGTALLCTMAIGGCSYGGIATTADGSTVYIARNNAMFFGVGRRIYLCKASGAILHCQTMDGEP